MDGHTPYSIEDLVLRVAAKVAARKKGGEHAELVLLATLEETLQSDPLILELAAVVDAYAETTPAAGSKIHPSHPGNPVRGYANALLVLQSMLLKKDPQPWRNAKDSEEDVCELHHQWFHYMEQCSRVVSEWGCVGPKAKSRHNLWFDSYILASDDDDRWQYYTKMCRLTFLTVSNRLELQSWRENVSSRPVVPIPVQLGATLYHLIHGADYETISVDFGIELSAVQETVENCVRDILRAMGDFLVWPHATAMQNAVISGFKEHWLLDDCRGVLGTIRVSVSPPKFKGSVTHVVALQGVCDSTGAFLTISCAHPGTLTDNEILRASNLYEGFENASRGIILKQSKASDQSGPYLLASQNYDPLPWLLLGNDEASVEDDFYFRIMMARSCITRAFKDLRRDFRCLGSGILCELSNAPAFIHVCCILHNFLYVKEVRPVRPSRSQLLNFCKADFDSNDEDSESDWESEDEEDQPVVTKSC